MTSDRRKHIMRNTYFSKITSILLIVMFAFTMIPSGIVLAESADYSYVITADRNSVVAGDTLILTVTLVGEIKDILTTQFVIEFSNDKFKVDTTKSRDPNKPNPYTFEEEWYSYVITSDPETFYRGGLGAINIPTVGQFVTEEDATKSRFTVSYSSNDGYTLDSGSSSYGDESTIAGKIIFTATADVTNLSKEFKLMNTTLQTKVGTNPLQDKTTIETQLPDIDMAKVNSVNDKINQITDPVTYSLKETIATARAEYATLNSDEQALVTNIGNLEIAETAITAIETNITTAINAITAIGTVKYPDSETLIADARTAYNKLNGDTAAQEAVTNSADLIAAENTFNSHKSAYEAAAPVNALISAIGTVEYTTACKEKIDAAQSAYNALTDELAKQYVKTDVLTAAVSKWNELDEIVKDFNDTIDGLVVDDITLDDEKLLGTLRNIYDNSMDANQKAAVGEARVEKLEACEDKIKALVEKQERIDNVKDKIDAAVSAMNGISGYDDAGLNAAKSLVEGARSAYEALTASDEIKAIDNIDTLVAAERKITNLDTAKSIDDLIGKIGTVTYPDSNDAILDARAKYDEYKENSEIIQYVKKYDTLVEAEGEYRKQQAAYNQAVADEVADLIELIPDDLTVSNLDNITGPLYTASSSFGALSPAQQELIDEALVEKLVNASAVYPKLEAAEPVYKDIEALGEIKLSSKTAIEEAEAAYDALDGDVKDYVENYDKLTAARERYEQLVDIKEVSDEIEEFLKMAVAYTDEYEAELDRVQELINGLGNLAAEIPDLVNGFNAKNDEFTAKETAQTNALNELLSIIDQIPNDIANITLADEDVIKAIQEAEAKYNSLLDKTKKQFEEEKPNEFEKLNDAGEKYDNLEKGAQEVANEIIAAINTIGNVTLDEEKLASIEAIRTKYNNNPASHEYISDETLKILEDAEAKVIELKADKAAVDNVIDLIEAIFPVEDSADFLERLNDAKDALDNLKEVLKTQVTNSADIAKAETQHAKLLEVKEAIDNIPDEIEYSTECNEKIKAAEKAYEELLALDTALDEQVNGKAIKNAREKYEGIKEALECYMDFVPEYGNNGLWMAVYRNIPANRSVKLGTYPATMVVLDGNVYYVVLTKEKLNTAEVVISETETPAEIQIIGDVNNSGKVTTTDALFINQKAARLDVDSFANDGDLMAYVRADVNGSGTFTALDALMAVKLFAQDEDTCPSLHVGYINPQLSK